MTTQVLRDIVTPELIADAIENREFHGFLEDYHVLHSLLKIHKPKTFFEIGTNFGTGTKIIKNALGPDAVVFSLDLPADRVHPSMVRPEGGDNVGANCKLPFVQLRGDSLTFDYSKYPCEGYFVDGEHDYTHPLVEARAAIACGAKLIVFHDMHVVPVQHAVRDAFADRDDYQVFRVTDTRIAYAVKK